jgi:uncharacterized protein HemX
MQRFLAVLALIVVLALVGMYAAGWMKFQASDETTTIEIKTGEIKDAAENAVDQSRELIEDAQKEIEKQTAPAEPGTTPGGASDVASPPET